MKTLQDYIAETEEWIDDPQVGDAFDIELAPDHLIETVILETTADGIVIEADEHLERLLESRGWLAEKIGTYGAVGYGGMGQTFFEKDLGEGGIDPNRHPQTRDYGTGDDEHKEEDLAIPGTYGMSDTERHAAIMKHYPEAKRVGTTPGVYQTKSGQLVSGIRGVRHIKDKDVAEGVNAKQIKKDLDAGMSYDAVIGKHANKRMTNTDEIRRVIQQHAWEKRTKTKTKEEQGVAEGMLDNIKLAWARLIAGLADKAIALDRTGELAGSQQRAIQHSTRELEQKLLAKIAGHPREDELRRHVDYIVAQAGQQTNFSDLAKTLHKMLDQFKPEMEKFSEGGMKDLDIELQDYKSMSPQEFERAYGMKKADWAMKHHDIIGKENLQVDWTGKTGFDYVKETSAYMARMLELAGLPRPVEEDQAADIVAKKEMDIDAARDLGEGSACNMTAEGESCPVHGLEECGSIEEAKYQGREVPLGKPMKGDVKKSKVYVRGPKGNVVKVNFGDKTMRIKKSNPKRRKNFRARHNCANPGPRHKARYWSCRAW